MGFFAFAENPIFLFFAIRPTPFDRGLCFFARIYAVQRIPTPFVRPFSIRAVPEIWGAPHSWKTDGVRPSNFVVCAYGHIFARERFPFSKIKDAPPYRLLSPFFIVYFLSVILIAWFYSYFSTKIRRFCVDFVKIVEPFTTDVWKTDNRKNPVDRGDIPVKARWNGSTRPSS